MTHANISLTSALLSLLHPRLFTSLVLIEPPFNGSLSIVQTFALLSIKRRDTWASRSEATKSATRSYARWDPRVLRRWNEHGYRSLPTTIYPQTDGEVKPTNGPVTLTGSKYQEAMLFLRPNFMGHTTSVLADSAKTPPHDPLMYPDIIDPPNPSMPFYRSEAIIVLKILKHIRPPVFYLFGGESPVSTPEDQALMLERTGAGFGGSGGVKHSQVKTAIILDCGHMVPFEKVGESASLVGRWVGQSVQRWRKDELRVHQKWTNQSTREALTAPAKWRPMLEEFFKSQGRTERWKI